MTYTEPNSDVLYGDDAKIYNIKYKNLNSIKRAKVNSKNHKKYSSYCTLLISLLQDFDYSKLLIMIIAHC